VLTDTAPGPANARDFVLRGVAASLALFGLLRLSWTEAQLVLPITRAQGALAVGLFGTPTLPVEATLACSGADALALCLGAIFAYPVTWSARLAGAGVGTALLLGLNTVRIGTLGQVVSSPVWFNTLHVYVWPVALTLAIAGYVFGWMRIADRLHRAERVAEPCERGITSRPQLSRRFVVLTVLFVLVFAAASPLYLESPGVLALAGFIARAAAVTLAVFGVSAHAVANVLWTPQGGFLVTQECISTPLVPVYLAAVGAYSPTRRRMLLGVAAALPIFVALGIVRLLVVALPAVVSPIFFVHAFYQLLAGAVIVVLAARWRHPARAALGYALVGVIAGVVFVQLLGPLYTRVITVPSGLPLDDPQGAIAFLPAFQVGLFLALSVAASVVRDWPRVLGGLAVLGLMQIVAVIALHALANYTDLAVHVANIRGWAVAGPVLIFVAVFNVARARR
jgi:exosortase/archaeosortase family protein